MKMGSDDYCETSRELTKSIRLFHCTHLAAALVALALPTLPATAATTLLRTQGQDIVNEKGEKILLRGVGLGNWMLPQGYMWKFGAQRDRPRRIEKLVNDLIGPENGKRCWSEFHKHYITETDIRLVAELGFNSVRPALNSGLTRNTRNEIKLDTIRLNRGTNRLKFLVTSGVADLDWIDLSLADLNRQAAQYAFDP